MSLRVCVPALLLAAALPAVGAERAPAASWPRVMDPFQSVADSWYLGDLEANPGSLGMFQGWELDFLHSTPAGGRTAALPGVGGQRLLLGGGGSLGRLGLAVAGGFEHLQAPGSGDVHTWVGGLAAALSYGRLAALGISWRWLRDGPWGGSADGSLGLSLRPLPWLAFGTALHQLEEARVPDGRLGRTLRAGVAFRPLSSPILSLAVDWEGFLEDGDTRQLLSRVRVVPVDGLALSAGFSAAREAGDWSFGGAASLSFQPGLRQARIHAGAAFDESGYGGFQAGLSLRSTSEPTIAAPRNTFVEVAITGALPERPGEGLFRAPSPSLLDLRLRLAELARDRYVSGVLLKITGAPGSFSQAQELAASIDHMRARGKRVHVYLEEAGNRSVFVAAHGDRVILNPATLLNMLGIHLVWRFYRDTLAAVGVEAQVVRFEEYKAAADPWIQSGSREVVRDAARDMMDATFDQLVGDIAALRGRPREEVEAWVDNSPMAPERARAAGVVDDIAGREGLEAIIRDHEGRPPRLVRSYPSPRAQDLRWGPPPRVAVVVLEGLMITGPSRSVPFLGLRFSGADTVASALDAAAADPSVGAILLRIQSPGGMALAAELVNRKVAEAAKKKPLAASIASAAASGGYYAAAAAPRIFVMPGSVTGSIGVVYGKPVISGLLDLLKVKREHMLRGRHADIECLDRRLSDLEMEHVRGELESLYRLFRERVAEGRKLAPERVHELARGRVWLGAEALRNGLADQEGGVLEALDWLLERMGARPGQRPELIYLPRGTLMGAVLREAGLAAAPGLSLDELAELVFLVARPGLWMLDLSFVDDIFRS